ncbi:MAG TPA: phosphoribosylformylglycinamidine cyclo-ligase [Candidatus Binatia bacterium]|nr:phosphoribosylformylglycinamidine cyclo-ligase [Candidatus Binatia bacterium]
MSRYRDAGVNIKKGEEAVDRIRALCRSTFNANVAADLGGFAGAYRIPGAPGKLLASSMDGVGTKLKVAVQCGRHDTIGEDLVCHCGNDILVHGASPLFFLDYIAMGTLDPKVVEEVVTGLAAGCRRVGCALIGGETAEMPGLYAPEDYDLAGAIVGIVSESDWIDGKEIAAGDQLLGLPAVGLHTNGYSLARKILFDTLGLGVNDRLPSGGTVGQELLKPHPYYGAQVTAARAAGAVRGMAHITGGGIPGNLVRVLPEGLAAEIRLGSWPVPEIFRFLCERGSVGDAEAYEVWNMGLGMILVVKREDAAAVERALAAGSHACHRVGQVLPGTREVRLRA